MEIGRFEIAQGVVEFHDASKPHPVSVDVVPINLVLSNFHTKPGGDNAYSFMAELGKRSADGTMRQTDALDPSSVALWLYKQRDMPG